VIEFDIDVEFDFEVDFEVDSISMSIDWHEGNLRAGGGTTRADGSENGIASWT
jgi:hypothetical protein